MLIELVVMPQVLVITGGSGGIGAATARLAGARGYAVALGYQQDRVGALRVVDELVALGGRAFAVQADVANEAEVVRLFETVDRELGSVSVLVNAAGIVGHQQRLVDMDGERLLRTFATNVVGSLLCAREAVRRMALDRGGSGGVIVNVSSAASRLGSAREYVDYAASKGAIDTFTLGLAKEVAAQGIRVNAVRPGIIDTHIHAKGGDPGRVERLKSAIPLGRAGTAAEVAEAILWLASTESSYCTGSILDVTGGR
jgi:NAD(P)-dependent dehydrogenase (short-subunit alcohol dehydrogenase family)